MEEENIQIKTVEMHTGGHPLRIITSGFPLVKGNTILAKRRYIRENLDHLRKLLMFEPRGHFDMYGALLVQPDNENADLAVIFLHNEGYSTMCGHAVIALGRYAVDSGILSTDTATDGEVPIFIQCSTRNSNWPSGAHNIKNSTKIANNKGFDVFIFFILFV